MLGGLQDKSGDKAELIARPVRFAAGNDAAEFFSGGLAGQP